MKKVNRRSWLGGAATAAVAIAQTATAKAVQVGIPIEQFWADDPTKQPGIAPGQVGTRSPFEKLVKSPSDISSRTPLQDLHGILTPSDLHFERHHNGVPTIDPAKYELLIHGMVDQPLVLTLAELKRFPSVSRIAFLECAGNFRSARQSPHPISNAVALGRYGN